MKNKLTWIIFISLFVGGVLWLFVTLNSKSETDTDDPLKALMEREEERINKEMDFLKMNEDLNEKLTGISVQNVHCEDEEQNQHVLSELVLQKPVLVYRYSELNCNTCYETELTSLQHFFANAHDKVVILCSYQIRKYFTIFKKMNQIVLPIYRIPQDAFSWILEDYNAPYYFVLHPDLTISHIYIPDKVFPERNRQYLESVKWFLSE